MRPKDLRAPFRWSQRHALIHDRVWYLPERLPNEEEHPVDSQFTFPGWEDASLFEKNQPIYLEYCSGNGGWIAEKAKSEPHLNWVAIELKFKRIKKIWSKIKNLQLPNLLAVCSEGHYLTQNYLPDASVSAVYINFPDPWPKRRHAKYRIIQEDFIKEIYRVLKPGALLTLVTDDIDYSEEMIQVLKLVSGFKSEFPFPYYSEDYPSYGTSFFEDLWREQGKSIRYHVFKRD